MGRYGGVSLMHRMTHLLALSVALAEAVIAGAVVVGVAWGGMG